MGTAAAPHLVVEIDGIAIPEKLVVAISIDRDLGQPDLATITLANPGDVYSRIAPAAKLVVYAGSFIIFTGEVVELETSYGGRTGSRATIRAMNNLHRMLRKRRSLTYTDKTDRDIVAQLAKDSGLDLAWRHDTTVTHAHVYQHGQSDLDLVRARAARIGCHVWCVGSMLHVAQPLFSDELPIELCVDEDSTDAQLRSFTPRLSAASVVGKVIVRGWNPETKELISGEATVQRSPLGAIHAVAASGAIGSEDTVTTDQPIWSREEATALARARLQEALLGFITGSAELTGNPHVELAKVVTITANAADKTDPFNGKYYVTGITHRVVAGSYTTSLRVARDAQGAP